MKTLLTLAFLSIACIAAGQSKRPIVHYNKLVELKGTEYTVAAVTESSKKMTSAKHSLLFINTRSGEQQEVTFPYRAYQEQIEHVKIDKLKLNIVITGAKTIDLNHKDGIGWEDPTQLFVLSIDGKRRTQITDDRFFVSTWNVNSETGRVVITGHYDTNGNGKHDEADEARVSLFDLAAMQTVAGR